MYVGHFNELNRGRLRWPVSNPLLQFIISIYLFTFDGCPVSKPRPCEPDAKTGRLQSLLRSWTPIGHVGNAKVVRWTVIVLSSGVRRFAGNWKNKFETRQLSDTLGYGNALKLLCKRMAYRTETGAILWRTLSWWKPPRGAADIEFPVCKSLRSLLTYVAFTMKRDRSIL